MKREITNATAQTQKKKRDRRRKGRQIQLEKNKNLYKQEFRILPPSLTVKV